MFDEGRQADLRHIEGRMQHATPETRRRLADLTHQIVSESREVRESRQRLIEATRSGDTHAIEHYQHRLKGETQA